MADFTQWCGWRIRKFRAGWHLVVPLDRSLDCAVYLWNNQVSAGFRPCRDAERRDGSDDREGVTHSEVGTRTSTSGFSAIHSTGGVRDRPGRLD
jgi:hypothetical protein